MYTIPRAAPQLLRPWKRSLITASTPSLRTIVCACSKWKCPASNPPRLTIIATITWWSRWARATSNSAAGDFEVALAQRDHQVIVAMIVNRGGLEAGHFHFEHAHTIVLKDGLTAVVRLSFHV